MGQAVDQAERERELTKHQLEENLGRFEARVRHELDWKARLRRDGARYAVMAAAAMATLLALVVLKAKLSGDEDAANDSVGVASLDDIAQQLQALRDEMERSRKGKDAQPMWQKAALRAVASAGAAGGALVARTLMERFAPDDDDAEPSADR